MTRSEPLAGDASRRVVQPAHPETQDPAGGAATLGSGRLGNVDALRAVAALAVLVGHAYFLGGRQIPIQAQYWYDVPLSATASGVWLFFAISGYVISRPFVERLVHGRSLPDLVPYALRRGLRIFPLYWITLTTFIALVGLGSTEAWQLAFHYSLLQNVVPGEQTALFTVAWTLTLEVLFYAAVPLLALAVRRFRPHVTAEALAVMVLVSWGASFVFTGFTAPLGDTESGIWLRGTFPSMWQMFCPGILLAIAPHVQSGSGRRAVDALTARGAMPLAISLLVAAAILSAAAPLRYGLVTYVTLVDLSRPLFAIGYGVILAAAIRARPWDLRMGSWVLQLGLVSYGIYLLHAVLQAFFLEGPGRSLIPMPHDGVLAYAVHVVFLAGLTIPLAIASWRWLEKPFVELSATLAARWREARTKPTVPQS